MFSFMTPIRSLNSIKLCWSFYIALHLTRHHNAEMYLSVSIIIVSYLASHIVSYLASYRASHKQEMHS